MKKIKSTLRRILEHLEKPLPPKSARKESDPENDPCFQSSKEPKLGNISQIKDSTPRDTRRIGKITDFVNSQDDLKRAAKVRIANKHTLQCLLIHGYRTQTNAVIDNSGVKTNEEPIKKTPKINGNDLQILRPKRQAANDEKR